jgi:hypothetical protein
VGDEHDGPVPRVRRALHVESGLNDGLITPAVTFFIAGALAEEVVSELMPLGTPSIDMCQTSDAAATDGIAFVSELVSAENLGFLLFELGVIDDPSVSEVCELGQLVDRSPAASGVPDVGLERLVPRLCLGDVALAHVVAARNHIHEDAQERDQQHEDQPRRLCPSAEVVAAEDVGDDPEEQEEPHDPQEENQY